MNEVLPECCKNTELPMIEGLSSINWPKASGTVQRTYVNERRNGYRESSTVYTPIVEYVFQVKGVVYVVNRIQTAPLDLRNGTEAQEIVSRFPAGSEVEVFYNPEDPRRALLEPGFGFFNFFRVAAGLIAFFWVQFIGGMNYGFW